MLILCQASLQKSAILPQLISVQGEATSCHRYESRERDEDTCPSSSHLILVVDDEPHICNVLRRILEKEGYKVITAPGGRTALQLIKEKKPDVILLDLMMPGMDGREVCRRVREFSTTTQIIYFTAKVEPIDPLKSKELRREVDAFITKPASSRQILSKVSGVLQGSRR